MSRLRSAAPVLLLAAVGLVPSAVVLWPRLPPMFEDEILPLVPLVPLLKDRAAYGNAFLGNAHVFVFGYPVALVSYVIEGPLKALFYAAALPLTRAAYQPEHLIAAYRASNVVWTWVLLAAMLGLCRSLAGWRAVVLCLALVVPDHSFVYLGLTDLSRPIHLTFGLGLLAVLCCHVERPALHDALPIALVTFLGEWDRADFLWFMAAASVAWPSTCSSGAGRAWSSCSATSWGSASRGRSCRSTSRWRRRAALRRRRCGSGPHLDAPPRPHGDDGHVGAYRRHFELGPHLFGQPYVAYRWAWMAECVGVLLALGVTGLGTRRPAYLVVAIFPAFLLTAVGATPQTYEIHHVTVVKPVLYVAASVLGGRLAGWRPAPVVVAWTALATARAPASSIFAAALPRLPVIVAPAFVPSTVTR